MPTPLTGLSSTTHRLTRGGDQSQSNVNSAGMHTWRGRVWQYKM